MKIQKIIPTLSIAAIGLTIVLGVIILLELSLHHLALKSLLFFSFSSFILVLSYTVSCFSVTSSHSIKKILCYVGLVIIAAGAIVWFGLFSSGQYWHLSIGMAIIYLLIVNLQLAGWSAKKPGILARIIALLLIIAHIFLVFIVVFKIAMLPLYPAIIIACTISALGLLYGLYFFQPSRKKTISS